MEIFDNLLVHLQNLLAMPAAQFALIPLLATFVIALILCPLRWTWSGIALVTGFYLAAYQLGLIDVSLFETLLAGEDIADFNGKMLILGLGALIIGLLFDIYWGDRKQSFPLLVILATAAGFWLFWTELSTKELVEVWPVAFGAIAYLVWMAAWSDGLRSEPMRISSIGLVLGLATAAVAIIDAGPETVYAQLGASEAIHAQLGIAFAAACLGFWLASIIMSRLQGGSMFALPVLFIGALLSLSAVLDQQLSPFFLVLLALLPVFGKIPLAVEPRRRFARALVFVIILLPLGVAAATAPLWKQAFDSSEEAAPEAVQTEQASESTEAMATEAAPAAETEMTPAADTPAEETEPAAETPAAETEAEPAAETETEAEPAAETESEPAATETETETEEQPAAETEETAPSTTTE